MKNNTSKQFILIIYNSKNSKSLNNTTPDWDIAKNVILSQFCPDADASFFTKVYTVNFFIEGFRPNFLFLNCFVSTTDDIKPQIDLGKCKPAPTSLLQTSGFLCDFQNVVTQLIMLV